MKERREFLKFMAGALAALLLPGCGRSGGARVLPMKKSGRRPVRGAVVWYSQAGHTERNGMIIARAWRKQGIKVTAGDYREIDPSILTSCDIIAAGSPVYYYDVPVNFREWLRNIPVITGTPVAGFVTFGGSGSNQHNTACALLEILAQRGGVPVGMALFGNMSTFAPTWSSGNARRVLKYRHLPNAATYRSVRSFAGKVLESARNGITHEIDREFSMTQLFRGGVSIWSTKVMIGEHSIDPEKCIACGTCEQKCPVGAISYEKHSVDRDSCIACMGCVNNCPAGAVNMTFMGKKVYGFNEFLKRNRIEIKEPEKSS